MPRPPAPPRPPKTTGALTPSTMLNQLLDAPDAPARVRQLSSVALHRLISTIGLADASELIALAAPEQVREVLDLEIWDGDHVALEEALDWLYLLTTLPDDVSRRDLQALDVELLGYVLLRHLRVYLLEEEEIPEEPEGMLHPTPDGWFMLEVIADSDISAERVVALVDSLYAIDPTEARRLLHNLKGELPTELEEWSYRWRNGRLQDLGFANPEEALQLYAYLNPRSVKADEHTADRTLVADPEPVGAPTELAQVFPAADSFLSRALAMIEEPAERKRLNTSLMYLSNMALAADRRDPDDLEGARATLEDLHWQLSLGLEFLADAQVERAPLVLAEVALLRIARLGHSLTLDLRRQLLGLHREGRLDRLDAPLDEQVRALLGLRPRYYEAKNGTTRAFQTLQDVAAARAWIDQACATVELMRSFMLPSPPPPEVTYGDLFRTAVVNQLLGREPARPLEIAGLAQFLQQFVYGGKLREETRDAASRAVPPRPAYQAVVSAWMDMLEENVARLDPAQLDPRYVAGLWLLHDEDPSRFT